MGGLHSSGGAHIWISTPASVSTQGSPIRRGADPAINDGKGADLATTDADPATKGGEGADPGTTNADPATNGGGGTDPSTTTNKSSRLGDSKPPPPIRADLAIAIKVSGYGLGVGGSGLMCSPTMKESLGRLMD
jgi:hypothetical protein